MELVKSGLDKLSQERDNNVKQVGSNTFHNNAVDTANIYIRVTQQFVGSVNKNSARIVAFTDSQIGVLTYV